jgi:hypothetical protein
MSICEQIKKSKNSLDELLARIADEEKPLRKSIIQLSQFIGHDLLACLYKEITGTSVGLLSEFELDKLRQSPIATFKSGKHTYEIQLFFNDSIMVRNNTFSSLMSKMNASNSDELSQLIDGTIADVLKRNAREFCKKIPPSDQHKIDDYKCLQQSTLDPYVYCFNGKKSKYDIRICALLLN